MNSKSAREQREQDRAYLKLPMNKKTNSKKSQTQKLFAFSRYFIYIVMSTAFFTNLCSFLPDNLISICIILHILDIVIASTIVILANDYTLRLQHNYKSQYQNKPTYWHYFIYVVVYKYVSIVNNNTRHLYTSPPYSPNPLYKAPFQHLLFSLLFYSSYSYSGGRTNLTTNKYLLIVIFIIFSQFFSSTFSASLRELFQLVLYVIFSFLYRFAWVDRENYDLGVLKTIFNRKMKYKFQKQQQSNNNLFSMLTNKIFNHQLLRSQKSSKKQSHRIIWATLSLTYFIFSTTKQVWQYWHWAIIWNIGIHISKSKQLNVKVIQNRYTNLVWTFTIIYLGQKLYYLLFQDRAEDSECSKVGNLLNFHISNIICLMVSGLYIMLEQDSVEFKQNHLIEGIYSIAMIQPSNYMNHSHLSQDKPYNLSVLLTKHILLVLTILQSIILYQIYSYKYHYHATKINTFHQQPHMASYNYTGDDNYSIYQNANFGYVLVLVCLFCSWCIYKMVPLYGIQFSHQASSSESSTKGLGYSQSYRKMLTRTLISTLVACCTYLVFKLNQTTDRYTSIIKQLIFLLPKCDKIQQFCKISQALHGCQSMDYTTTSILSILSILILLYWYLGQKTKYSNKFQKQYQHLLTDWLFYLCSFTLITLCIVGLLNWQCFSLNNWILIYLLSIVLSIMFLINNSQSFLKYKQF